MRPRCVAKSRPQLYLHVCNDLETQWPVAKWGRAQCFCLCFCQVPSKVRKMVATPGFQGPWAMNRKLGSSTPPSCARGALSRCSILFITHQQHLLAVQLHRALYLHAMESFFGKAKPSRPAVATHVTVKKVVKPAAAARPASSFHAATSSSSSSKLHRAGPSSHGHQSHSHSSLSARPKPPSSRDRDGTPRSKPTSSRGLSPRLSTSGTASPARKRKASPQRVLPPSDSESESSDDALAPKRKRFASAGAVPDAEDVDIGRPVFCPSLADKRGEWGRGYAGFVTCEEALKGVVHGWAGGNREVKESAREKYQSCKSSSHHYLPSSPSSPPHCALC